MQWRMDSPVVNQSRSKGALWNDVAQWQRFFVSVPIVDPSCGIPYILYPYRGVLRHNHKDYECKENQNFRDK
jgi:hypothetical protein